jgi:hypothetical protein
MQIEKQLERNIEALRLLPLSWLVVQSIEALEKAIVEVQNRKVTL